MIRAGILWVSPHDGDAELLSRRGGPVGNLAAEAAGTVDDAIPLRPAIVGENADEGFSVPAGRRQH